MATHRAPRRRRRPLVALLTVAALMAGGSAGYTVRPGDTLWSIAADHGISVSRLISSNGLSDPDVIHPGLSLSLPGGSASSSTGGAGTVHVVAPGETLMGISIRSGVTMARIAAANNLQSLNWVYAGQRLTIPSATGSVPTAPAPVAAATTTSLTPSRADVGVLLEQTAQRYGFNPAFIKAIAYQESGWNQAARSSAGAVGVMQVLPSTGDFVADYLVGRPLDITQTQDNITAGVAFVSYLYRLTGGDVRKTLAGYYQGLRSVSDNGMYPSTKLYIANILALRDRF